MSDFNTYDQITIRPWSNVVPYEFEFTTATNASSNDGFLPTGTTITAVSAQAYDESDNLNSDLIVGSPVVVNNIVSVDMKYPGAGRYQIRFRLSDGTSIFQANFDSIFAYTD